MADNRVVFLLDEKPECCFVCPLGINEDEDGEPERHCGVRGKREKCPPEDCPLVPVSEVRHEG